MRPGYGEQAKDGAVALQQNPFSLGAFNLRSETSMVSSPPQIDANWVAAIVALFALLLSAFALWHSQRNRREDMERSLVLQRNAINAAIAEFKVRGPIAYLLRIQDEDLEQFSPKLHLLLMQLNLLNDVYKNRGVLGSTTFAAHESWAKNILAPWIADDQHLRDAVMLIYATEDLMQKEFVDWLKQRISVTQRADHPPRAVRASSSR